MKNTSNRRTYIYITFGLYSILILFMMFIAYPGVNRLERLNDRMDYNLTPFHTIKDMIYSNRHTFFDRVIVNLVGNIVGFTPIGIFLPIIFKKLRNFWKFSLFFIGMMTFLELSQLFLRVGVADIDDVILNYLGGVLGFLLFKFFNTKFNLNLQLIK